ncbi:hypothetical protein IWX65_000144 [Arthrobacter sp. CAN_A214]|uniref:hypothetical protein n=1 Tax=Arthrobacter sp. CAN_A214 TaxID=2787720 RepID=UPI001A24DB8A
MARRQQEFPEGGRQTRERDDRELLETSAAQALLTAALASMGYVLHSWSLLQVSHRPGAGVTGVYSVEAGSGTPAPAPAPAPEFLCITTAVVPVGAPGVVSLSGPQRQTLFAWAHPGDPLLPGLAWATDPKAVSPALFPPPDGCRIDRRPVSLRTASYRPLRRAVLVAEHDGERRYLKVLRRGQAGAMGNRHRLLRDAGVPAPELVDVPGEDVVAMHAAAGRPLAELLMRDGAAEVAPQVLVNLLQELPESVLDLPRRLRGARGCAATARARPQCFRPPRDESMTCRRPSTIWSVGPTPGRWCPRMGISMRRTC